MSHGNQCAQMHPNMLLDMLGQKQGKKLVKNGLGSNNANNQGDSFQKNSNDLYTISTGSGLNAFSKIWDSPKPQMELSVWFGSTPEPEP